MRKRRERRKYQRVYMEQWRYSTLERCLKNKVIDARKRATRKGVRCTITSQYIIGLFEKQNGLCAMTGWSLTFDRAHMRTTNVSIDRVKPSRGYVRGNCRLVCDVVNTSRWDMNDLVFVKMCTAVTANYIARCS